jgi:hypothetical protein
MTQTLKFYDTEICAEQCKEIVAKVIDGKVKELVITRCSLSDNSAEIIAKHLLTPQSPLVILDLSENEIGPRGMLALVEVIKNTTKLQEINLLYNPIMPQEVNALISALENNLSIIKFEIPIPRQFISKNWNYENEALQKIQQSLERNLQLKAQIEQQLQEHVASSNSNDEAGVTLEVEHNTTLTGNDSNQEVS